MIYNNKMAMMKENKTEKASQQFIAKVSTNGNMALGS